MPVNTPAEFLEVLKKSKLLSESQLDSVRELCEQEEDPKDVARSLIRDRTLTKWQALHLLAGRYALTLGKYRFLDQIDADDRHRLFLAEHPQLGRQVTVQTLTRRHASQNPVAVKQFLDQGRKLASLEHPSILHAYDVDSEGDRCFIVMEHVQGRRLPQIIADQGPLPIDLVLEYLAQIARGLAYAHERDVPHGDLRPSNVVIAEHGNVRIANLGVAGLTADEDQLSSGEKQSGPQDPYAAPELQEPGTSCGPSSDLYAMGGLVFAMLTGHDPEPGQAGETLLEQRPEVPQAVVQLFEKLTAADPSQRYPSAAEVLQAIETCKAALGEAPAGPRVEIETSKGPSKSASTSEKRGDASAKQVPPGPPKRKPAEKSATAESGRTDPAETPVWAGIVEEDDKTPVTEDAGEDGARSEAVESGPRIAVPGLPEAPTAKTTPGALAINTKSRRRKKKPTAAKSAVAKPAPEAPSDDASPPKAGIPKVAYIAGGAAIGGIVLITAAVLLFMSVFSGGDEVQVAQGEAATETTTESATSTDTGSTAESAESDPWLGVESDPLPEETDPELPVAVAPETSAETQPAEQPGPGTDAGTSETGATPTPAEPPATTDSGGGEPGTVPGAKPETAPGVNPQTSVGTAEKPAAEKPAAEKTPVETPKPEPKVEPAKPKPEPPAAKPKTPAKKAFAEFPAVASLPSLEGPDAMNPQLLGPVYRGDEICFIRLRGGEKAMKGAQTFAMRNADGGLAETAWEIYMREGAAGSETKIADLLLNDQSQLMFQWQPPAKADPAAAYLTNCALSFTCRGDTHVALLRQPTQASALEIDLNEPALKQDWKIDMLPDPENVRVEIRGIKGAKYSIEPQPVIKSDNGEAWIKLEDGGGLLSLKVETDLRKDFQVLVSPYVRMSSDAKPEKLVARKLQPVKAQLEAAVQQWNFQVQQGQAFMKSKAPEAAKKQAEQQLRNFENELKNSQETLEKFNRFEELLKNTKPQLSFRVFYDADGSEVNLLTVGS